MLSNTTEPANRSLPDRVVNLLQESRWLLLAAGALFLMLSLGGFQRTDPGWSHSIKTATLQNPAGKAGAWLSDLLLYLFGLSAWWWVLLLLAMVWWGYRDLNHAEEEASSEDTERNSRIKLVSFSGFFLLLLSSSAVEALRFYSLNLELPLAPGGMVGAELSRFAFVYLGFDGATLFLLGAGALGWSLFVQMSWLRFCELTGGLLELLYVTLVRHRDNWQDRRIGREMAQQREAVVVS